MEQIDLFLFGLTPRAGRHNHKYLLPGSAEQLRRRADQLAGEVVRSVEHESARADRGLARGENFLVAWQTVTQPTTGRSAPEWLCLTTNVPAALDCPQLADWLQGKLDELAALVQSYQWDQTTGLHETMPKLAEWQNEAAEMVKTLCRDAPTLDGSKKEDQLSRRWPTKTSMTGAHRSGPSPIAAGRRRNKGFLWAAFGVCFLVLLGVVFLLTAPDWRKLVPTDRLQQHKGVQSQPTLDDWQRLAYACGVDPKLVLNELLPRLHEKLKDLGLEASPENPQRLPEGDIKKRIHEILKLFEREVVNGSGNTTQDLHHLVKSPEIREALEKLFPKKATHQFDPLGLVRGTSDWHQELIVWLEGVSADQLDQVAEIIIRPHHVKQDSPNPWRTQGPPDNNYAGVLGAVAAACDELQTIERSNRPASSFRRRFYIARDERKALVLKQLFEKLATEKEALGDLIPPRGIAKPTITLCDWLVSVKDAFSSSSKGKLREKLETRKKDYELHNDHGNARTIGNLITLLEHWAEIGSQLSPKSQPSYPRRENAPSSPPGPNQ